MATTRRAEVTAQSLRIRSGPGTSFGILTTVSAGTMLEVLEQVGDWLKVTYSGGQGYVAAQFVTIKPAAAPQGFLIEQPDLLDIQLAPDRLIPADNLESKAEIAVASTWNSYGNLMSRLSDLLAVPVGALVAVLVAESSGRAFAADGRMIVRFENHLFWRFWGQNNPEVFNRHFKFDTSSPANNWKSHQWRPNVETPWQSFHGTQSKEWDVLSFARALDDTAALSSISMGAPQVMGFNFKRLGYESVQHMFDAFARSAHAQILALFDFVKGPAETSRAIQALQRGDYLTFANFYNGPANAPTYQDIIQVRADIFARLIRTAVAATPPTEPQRGPVEAPVPPAPTPPVPAPLPIPATPAPVPPRPSAPTTPPAPAENRGEVLIATVAGLNVRREPAVQPDNIIEKLNQNEPVTPLEPMDQVMEKIAAGEAGKRFIKIRTDEGREGFAAAWLLAPGEALVRQTTDTYIASIPDKYPVPSAYDSFWAEQDRLGLPDPFDSLPVLIRTPHQLVNMQVNGFGPNSFAARNWRRWYSRIGGMHNGLDFIVETGTPLLAVTDGVIIRNWPFMGDPAEKTITLWPFLPGRFRDSRGHRMMSNILVAYGHMSNNGLKQDLDVVRAGDIIGVSGTPAGSTTNDHLHLEVHFLSGDTGFLNLRKLPARRLLAACKRPQPMSNQMPWNPLLFNSRRLIKYQLNQSRTIGYLGRPAYPTRDTLKEMGANHLPDLDEFSVAAFEYGIPVVWGARSTPWPQGVATIDSLADRARAFTPYEPYEAAFLSA